jgi:hypothetical protein
MSRPEGEEVSALRTVAIAGLQSMNSGGRD